MKFTIGTVSSSLDFDEDLKLIKSSLLYADEIELIGMAEYSVFKYLPDIINSVKDINSFVGSFIPLLKSINVDGASEMALQLEMLKDQTATYGQLLKKKKHRSKQEIFTQLKMKQVMDESKSILLEGASQLTSSVGANEIAKLIDKKIISVFDYDNNDFNFDALAGGYFGNLIGTMQNGTAYPLFDKTSNEVIASCARNELFDLGNVNQEVLVHAGLATNILMTLPTLESTSIDEILDFKKELKGPLVRFRSAIYSFSEEMKSRPWDKDFQYECLKMYSKEVAPRVEELNELASDTSVLKNMGRKVLADEDIRKKAGWLTGGLVTSITTSNNMQGAFDVLRNWLLGLSTVVIAPNAVQAFMKTLNIASETKQEAEKVKREMRGNTMYYYYKALIELQ